MGRLEAAGTPGDPDDEVYTAWAIHYGTFDFPPSYAEYPDADVPSSSRQGERGVAVRLLSQGELVDLD